MSDDVMGVVICAGMLAACLAIGFLVQWLGERQARTDLQWIAAEFPRVYGSCQVPGCRAPATRLRVVWSYDEGRDEGEPCGDDRQYWLCRHHREQAQARVDDSIEDMVAV